MYHSMWEWYIYTTCIKSFFACFCHTKEDISVFARVCISSDDEVHATISKFCYIYTVTCMILHDISIACDDITQYRSCVIDILIICNTYCYIYSDYSLCSIIHDISICHRSIWNDGNFIFWSKKVGREDTDLFYCTKYSLSFDKISYFIWFEDQDKHTTSKISKTSL